MDLRVLVTGATTPAGRSMLEALHSDSIELIACDSDAGLSRLVAEDGIEVFWVHASDHPEFVGELVTLCVQHDVDVVVPMREGDQLALARVPRIFDQLGSPVWLAPIPMHTTQSHVRRILQLAARNRNRAGVGEWLRRISNLTGAQASP
jgi:hypothetical protein